MTADDQTTEVPIPVGIVLAVPIYHCRGCDLLTVRGVRALAHCPDCGADGLIETVGYQCAICGDLYLPQEETEAHVRGEHAYRLGQGLPMGPTGSDQSVDDQAQEAAPVWDDERREKARTEFFQWFGLDLTKLGEEDLLAIDQALHNGHALITLMLEDIATAEDGGTGS